MQIEVQRRLHEQLEVSYPYNTCTTIENIKDFLQLKKHLEIAVNRGYTFVVVSRNIKAFSLNFVFKTEPGTATFAAQNRGSRKVPAISFGEGARDSWKTKPQ